MRQLEKLMTEVIIEKSDFERGFREIGCFGDLRIVQYNQFRYLCQKAGDDYYILYSYQRKKTERRQRRSFL